MGDHYDFSHGVRGKHAGKIDTSDVFHDFEEVIRHESADTLVSTCARPTEQISHVGCAAILVSTRCVISPVPNLKAGAAMPNQDLDRLLRSAIEQRRLLRLRYQNKERIIEPHDYGERKGVVTLLAYQVGGFSNGPLPNWRWLEVHGISDAHLLDQTFAGGRLVPTAKHHAWDKLYLRVESAA